uniref:Secreted protein n=1 Tax=Anguilla anguilla TaxID=7936 RepID=A0A0E9Y065_ANGAN
MVLFYCFCFFLVGPPDGGTSVLCPAHSPVNCIIVFHYCLVILSLFPPVSCYPLLFWFDCFLSSPVSCYPLSI